VVDAVDKPVARCIARCIGAGAVCGVREPLGEWHLRARANEAPPPAVGPGAPLGFEQWARTGAHSA
jgi:hypothetical protein